MSTYDIIDITFHSSYPSANLSSLETVSDCLTNQVFYENIIV